MKDARRSTACRYCGSSRLTPFLSLGHQPPSNSFIRPDQIGSERRYPLEVCFCENCYLVQLWDVVPAELIFNDYLYLSSSSKALKHHYGCLADLVTQRFDLKAGDLVVDIGCNDGILLNSYQLPGLLKVGVEPSKVAEIAAASALEVIRSFFSLDVARQIIETHGLAKVVTATNVFAHVDDISGFVEGLLPLLTQDGVFVIEAPYLIDLIDQTLFDTIYHEHLCYLSLTPMVPFLARHRLEVFDVQRVPFGASGPAFRVFVRRMGSQNPAEPAVSKMLAEEAVWGVQRTDNYLRFATHIEHLKDLLLSTLSKLRASCASIGGYGAPAKGNTLLNYFGLNAEWIQCIAETNPLKQGLLTPGAHIPIVSEEEFLKKMPAYALLLSWNYFDFLLENSEYISRGGRFIVPLPQVRIAPRV